MVDAEGGIFCGSAPEFGGNPISAWARERDFAGHRHYNSLVGALRKTGWPSRLHVRLETKQRFATVFGLHVKEDVMASVGLGPRHKDGEANAEVERRGTRLVILDDLIHVGEPGAHHVKEAVMGFGMVRKQQ